MLASHFISLQAIWHGILYIHQPYEAKDVFICFDSNGTKNDSWPLKWKRMMPSTTINESILTSSIPKNSTMYKLRLRMDDNSTKETKWYQLFSKCPPPLNANIIKPDCKVELGAVSYLIYFITLCSSLLVTESVVGIIQKIWNQY